MVDKHTRADEVAAVDSSGQRGADLRYDLEITLEQAAVGMTAQLRIPKLESCESCKGSGAAAGTNPETCRTCQGAGQVRWPDDRSAARQPAPGA